MARELSPQDLREARGAALAQGRSSIMIEDPVTGSPRIVQVEDRIPDVNAIAARTRNMLPRQGELLAAALNPHPTEPGTDDLDAHRGE